MFGAYNVYSCDATLADEFLDSDQYQWQGSYPTNGDAQAKVKELQGQGLHAWYEYAEPQISLTE